MLCKRGSVAALSLLVAFFVFSVSANPASASAIGGSTSHTQLLIPAGPGDITLPDPTDPNPHGPDDKTAPQPSDPNPQGPDDKTAPLPSDPTPEAPDDKTGPVPGDPDPDVPDDKTGPNPGDPTPDDDDPDGADQGTEPGNEDGNEDGNDEGDGSNVVQLPKTGTGTHQSNALLPIGMLLAFALVTGLTALLATREHETD